jgi:LysM repeat protein
MSKKIGVILIVMLVFTVSACTRSASSAPVGTATPKANFPTPLATTGINIVEMAGTQTAVANAGALPMPTAVGASGVPLLPTFTPLAGVDLTPAGSVPENTPLPSPTSDMLETPVPLPTADNSSPVSAPNTYTLHDGEFPYCLARRFNVNPQELLSLNNLSATQTYFAPGTTISIPQTGNTFPGGRALLDHPAQYTVQSGDTIYKIACDFGDVDPLAIANDNGLSGSETLTAGTVLQIP